MTTKTRVITLTTLINQVTTILFPRPADYFGTPIHILSTFFLFHYAIAFLGLPPAVFLSN